MKLWQKIFLLTLALVIAAVSVTSLILLSNNHNLAIEREQQEGLARHNYIVVEMQNRVIYTQLYDRVVTLSEEDTLAVAREVLSGQRSDSTLSLALYKNTQLVGSVNFESNLQRYQRSLLVEDDYTSVIIEAGNRDYLLLVSSVVLNNITYKLVSTFDITATYELFEADLNLVSLISVVSGLLVAGLLLLLTQGLLSPLHNLSTTTRLIAEGDLNRRTSVKGHDEVSEVAKNFNIMADSIEHNVTTLESLAESRRIFIGNLAHEMKTPLTSILGFADLLRIKREVSDEERMEYASIIVSETKHLQGLSGKLMELLATQNVQLSFETIDAQDFSEKFARSLHPLHMRTQTTLIVEAEDLTFEADSELLTSLLYNLIDNAVKASPPGNTVTLSIEYLNNDRTEVCLIIADEGAGIPAEQIPLLTEPFYMLDKSRTRKHGGAGLGLALCVEIVQAHGGSLQIESELGKGTQVIVILPKKASPPDDKRVAPLDDEAALKASKAKEEVHGAE